MKSDYWIKLYHEILDDSKMGTLPDRLWRRCIEMFLLAGRFGGMNKDGVLPSTNELAWVLRIEPDELELDLKQLQFIGILEPLPNGWLVVHFAERQAAVPAAERGKQFRQKHAGLPANVTITQPERYSNETFVEAESETESEAETEKNSGVAQPDSFISMVMQTTGLMVSANDMQAVMTWEKAGVTEGDIRDALNWRKENNKPPIKTISHLNGGIEMARLKRIQGANAYPSPKGEDIMPLTPSERIARDAAEIKKNLRVRG